MPEPDIKNGATTVHLFLGIVMGLIVSTIGVTTYGGDIKHTANSAKKMATDNHEDIKDLKSWTHRYAIKSEARFSEIKADIRVIHHQNGEIIKQLDAMQKNHIDNEKY